MVLLLSVLAACGVESSGDAPEPKEEVKEVVKEEPKEQEKDYNQEVVNNEKITATIIDVKKEEEVFQVTFEIENKSDKTIIVQSREVSADGKMIDDSMIFMSEEVSGGKKADAVLKIQNYDEEKEFPTIEENMELLLFVVNDDDLTSYEEYPVTIELN